MGNREDEHVLETLRSLVGGGHERAVYECRHCGATVEGPGETCPDCGGTDIARFSL